MGNYDLIIVCESFTASIPIWRRIIYIVCGFTMNENVRTTSFSKQIYLCDNGTLITRNFLTIEQDCDHDGPCGYQMRAKSAKDKAKEAVDALNEPDHLQRY